MNHWVDETSLKGSHIELIPLNKNHKEELLQAASDGELWNLWYTEVPSPETIDQHIDDAIKAKQNNGDLPFVVRDIKSGQLIGSTRYCHVDNLNCRLEIGYTWYAKSFQRSKVNTECKLLLLTHAFESLKAIAVEFRTHRFNQRSRKAILRLGAVQDGIIRNHRKLPDGSIRDTMIYSIVESEWLSVKNNLVSKLAN